jgi:putative component of membrane protein insertase Oxa1/YidC/SpoIIIJ protein YidD
MILFWRGGVFNLLYSLRIACFGLSMALSSSLVWADDSGPWDFERKPGRLPAREVVIDDPLSATSHPIKRGMGGMLRFFQDVLSPLDGPKCHHYPTCSQFAREAISLYGPGWGVILTANRLTREYPGQVDSGHYPRVYAGIWRSYDPPEHHWLWGPYFLLPEGMRSLSEGMALDTHDNVP